MLSQIGFVVAPRTFHQLQGPAEMGTEPGPGLELLCLSPCLGVKPRWVPLLFSPRKLSPLLF